MIMIAVFLIITIIILLLSVLLINLYIKVLSIKLIKEANKKLKWGWSIKRSVIYGITEGGIKGSLHLESNWGYFSQSIKFIKVDGKYEIIGFDKIYHMMDLNDQLNCHIPQADIKRNNIEYNRERKLKELGL